MLILWSSRGWILAADALVELWITLHNISLSFYPPHFRLTPLFPPPPSSTPPPPPENPKIITYRNPLLPEPTEKTRLHRSSSFSNVQTREFRVSQAGVKRRQRDCSSPSSSRNGSSRPGKRGEKQAVSKAVQRRSCKERQSRFFRTVQLYACRNGEKARPRIKKKKQTG